MVEDSDGFAVGGVAEGSHKAVMEGVLEVSPL